MEEVYDALMQEVEPELTIDSMQYHEEWFVDEAPEETAVRHARYEKAFDVVEDRLSQVVSVWKNDLQKFRTKVMKKKEGKSRDDDSAGMMDLEDSIKRQ